MSIYSEKNRPKNQKYIRGVIVNPVLRDGFDSTDNELRPDQEWADWYGLAYIVDNGAGWHIRCLNGGAWDRSTMIGFSDTMDGAIDKVLEFIETHNPDPLSDHLELK